MPQMRVEEVIEQMRQIREQSGEAAFTAARDTLVKMLINDPRGEPFLKTVFPDLDLEPYKGQASATDESMMEALRAKTPHLKTQMQMRLLVSGADAYMLAMDCLFAGKKEEAKQAMNAVIAIWDAAEKATEISEQVAEIPTEERSATASEFVEAPIKQDEIYTRLMYETTQITSKEALEIWYRDRRAQMDKLSNQTYRNGLFDRIRELKGSFSN